MRVVSRRSLNALACIASSSGLAFRIAALAVALSLAGQRPTQSRPLPPAPEHLAIASGDRQVTLDWSPVNDAIAYRILYASDAGGPYAPVAPRFSSPLYGQWPDELGATLLHGHCT